MSEPKACSSSSTEPETSAEPEASNSSSENAFVETASDPCRKPLAAYDLGRGSRILEYWYEMLWAESEPEEKTLDMVVWASVAFEDALTQLAEVINPGVLVRIHELLKRMAEEDERIAANRMDPFALEPEKPALPGRGEAIAIMVLVDKALKPDTDLYTWCRLGAAVGDCQLALIGVDLDLPSFRPIVLCAQALPYKDISRIPELERLANLDLKDQLSPLQTLEHALARKISPEELIIGMDEQGRPMEMVFQHRLLIDMLEELNSRIRPALPWIRLPEPKVLSVLPHWDGRRRCLMFGGTVVRHYKRDTAKDQIAVLREFERQKWAAKVMVDLRNPKYAVYQLNKGLAPKLIKFRTELGFVCWEPIAAAEQS